MNQSIAKEDGSFVVSRPNDEHMSKSLHGLSHTLVNNMVIGVTTGYTKTLGFGTGYPRRPKGAGLELQLGFSVTLCRLMLLEASSSQSKTPTLQRRRHRQAEVGK